VFPEKVVKFAVTILSTLGAPYSYAYTAPPDIIAVLAVNVEFVMFSGASYIYTAPP
jgi:hypothetical protein